MSAERTEAAAQAQFRGTAHVLFARDIGARIDLQAVRARLAASEATLGRRHGAPTWFEFDPPPLRVVQRGERLPAGRCRTTGETEITLFDFGVASVGFGVPFEGSLQDLVDLTAALGSDDGLAAAAGHTCEALMSSLGEAVHSARLDLLVEDYIVIHVRELPPGLAATALLERHGPDLARVLRAEQQGLAAQEIEEALSLRVAYTPGDLTLVDWNTALVFDRDAEAVRAVLEFANVQLLEMRFLDRRLDESLDRSWELLRARRLLDRLRGPGPAMEHVARLQVDAALLYERITNALKLLGDQYLARVWAHASRRLRLPDWNAAILHKLDTLDRIHSQLAQRASTLRLEALEWIVIALIAVSIVTSMH
ncbi:MAG TPA: hypothetical protein VFY71_02805 [Planctomycetota bacterium]|nr:hypothetical protein [Planctomycetota bacterium]